MPLTEHEREQWIYEDMLESIRRGDTYTPRDMPDELPDFTMPTYVRPEAMIHADPAPADPDDADAAPEGEPVNSDEAVEHEQVDAAESDPPAEAIPAPRTRRDHRHRGAEAASRPSRRGQRRVKKPTLGRRIMRLWPVGLAIVVVAAIATMATVFYHHYQLTHPSGVSESLEISGDTDSVPVVSLNAALPLTFAKSQVVTEGKGPQLSEGSPVLLRLTVFDGTTGELVSSGDMPHYIAGRVNSETLMPELKTAVMNQRVGSRLALRRPVSRDGEQAMEIDVIDVLSTEPTGEVMPADPGAPVSIGDSSGVPQLASLAEEPPNAAYLKVLRAGEGAQVSNGQSVIANFAVWRWHDKSQTSNTWEGKGPQVIDLAGAMTGLREQLYDQRVGSRVLIVLPPEQAKGDDTLIVVADILAVIDTTSQE
ncbi:hypothetical protein H8R18_03820 [Nanchangia anserum]|uniref:Peptidylprolyl isomerase n=1 Tax=Nanchangia anserum TaxID=2692125 RepID=A0A8I0KTJ6_9ACTO|nr:hypothetical protein [Nanchangia anserum]MBD3688688.1 hypothetical protein [Nanchangia anserum]QOX82437.1 hypothetical protein H8R18_03820 [Nanchangia anserum]